jgi:hypothetical protein
VDYQDEKDKEHEQPEDESDYQFDDELDDVEAYDRIDQGEIDDLLSEEAEQGIANDANTIDREKEQEEVKQEQVKQVPLEIEPDPDPITDDDNTVQTESSRLSRDRKEPDRLTFCQTPGKHVSCKDNEWHKLERCHNLVAQAHPNPDQDRSYTPQKAMVIARVISDINS